MSTSRFLAFADSRKMVEQLVAVAERSVNQEEESTQEDDEIEDNQYEERASVVSNLRILPYRAGYEEEDRLEIQNSLMRGDLAGVVSTSALELGLDIGEIDIVLLLATPPSVKAFWQRLGRAGRKNAGCCLLVDDSGIIARSAMGLRGYLQKHPEPGWLYLENEYIQYSHALCASVEVSETIEAEYTKVPFQSLPNAFLRYLENELNPSESVPEELYPLKQRAQAGPHYEFPLRSSVDKEFDVLEARPGEQYDRLGSLAYSQAVREAYPGAIYYYMARPYRVYQFNYRTAEIRVRRARRWTTQPLLQNMVFPKFPDGALNLRRSNDGFVAEAKMQVSERVMGFTEHKGPKQTQNLYGPGSPYMQRPISRFFETTGFCWYFPNRAVLSESVVQLIMMTFCRVCGIQERDLGIGTFHTKSSSVWANECQDICIYDAVHGSLRLTRQLSDHFVDILNTTIQLTEVLETRDTFLEASLKRLLEYVAATIPTDVQFAEQQIETTTDWMTIIAPGEKAIYQSAGGSEEVHVVNFRFTPHGPMYQLNSPRPDVTWMVKASRVIPIHGVTRLIELNLFTGETREIS